MSNDKNNRNESGSVSESAKRREKLAAAKKKEKRRIRLLTVGTLAAIVLIVGGLVLNTVGHSSGYYKRNTIAAKSKSYKIDNAMMSYFFFTEYGNFLNQYGSYISYFGLSTSAPLKMQTAFTGNESWYDYFLRNTKSGLSDMLIKAEAAIDAGYVLTDKDNESIDKYIQDIKDYIADSKYTEREYLNSAYGTGVNYDDIRRCLELSVYATSYYNSVMDAQEYTNQQHQEYYDKNANDFKYVDFKKFVIEYGSDKDITTNLAARDIAAELASVTTAAEFDAWVGEFLKDKKDSEGKDYTEETLKEAIAATLNAYQLYKEPETSSDTSSTTASDTSSTTASDTSSAGDTSSDTSSSTSSATSSEQKKDETEAILWLYSGDRSAGEAKYFFYEGEYEVYLITEPLRRIENSTANVRHILVTDDEEAEEGSEETTQTAEEKAKAILDEWLAGAKTSESFGELAEKYTEDTGSAEDGGLYENVWLDDMVDEFEAWLFTEGHKPGDYGTIESDYGTHIMYFDSYGIPAWERQVNDAMLSDYSSTWLKELGEEYPITYYDSRIGKIAQ